MDETGVRERLAEAKAELGRLDAEREAWLNLVKGYEGILRVRGSGSDGQIPLAFEVKAAGRKVRDSGQRAGPSFRGAMKKVLQDAHGEGLHTKEILRRILEMGATTTAKDPQAVTDLMGYSLAKSGEVEKVGPRTWRWTGGEGT